LERGTNFCNNEDNRDISMTKTATKPKFVGSNDRRWKIRKSEQGAQKVLMPIFKNSQDRKGAKI
jgi:hypothetical protein